MRTLAIIVGLNLVAVASSAEPQTSSTNLPTIDQAPRVAAHLKLGTRETNATAVLEDGGLKCNVVHLGGSFYWLNYCDLAGTNHLALEFKNGPRQTGHWEDGRLEAAYVTASNRVKVISVNVANASNQHVQATPR